MRRDLAIVGLWTAASVAAIAGLAAGPDGDARDLPEVTARPGPRLVAVEDLRVAATATLPGFRAAAARPASDGVFAIGGVPTALALRDVGLELADARGVAVAAARGAWTAAGLALDDVTVTVDGRPRLRTAALTVADGALVGDRLVAWLGADGLGDVRGAVRLPLAGLREALDAGPD